MRLGSRAKLTIGVGVLAAAGFVVLGLRDLNSPAQSASGQAERLNPPPAAPQALLAAATRAIRTGETITADMVRGAALDPARFPMAAAPVEAIGKVATRDIAAGVLIPRTALDHEAKLAIRVPLGMRAISIDTTAEIAVAGLLRPGDRVDVQVVYPGADAISGARGVGRSQAQTLLQMVHVLAVGDTVVGTQPASGSSGDGVEDSGSQSKSSAPAPAVARTVTLALFSRAGFAALARQEHGRALPVAAQSAGRRPAAGRAGLIERSAARTCDGACARRGSGDDAADAARRARSRSRSNQAAMNRVRVRNGCAPIPNSAG